MNDDGSRTSGLRPNLDITPDSGGFPDTPPASVTLFLVKTQLHFDWAHLADDECLHRGCQTMATHPEVGQWYRSSPGSRGPPTRQGPPSTPDSSQTSGDANPPVSHKQSRTAQVGPQDPVVKKRKLKRTTKSAGDTGHRCDQHHQHDVRICHHQEAKEAPTPTTTCLTLRKVDKGGSSLLRCLSQALGHTLSMDATAFNVHSAPSYVASITALLDPSVMRHELCNLLAGPFQHTQCELLFGRTPRQAVLQDYVEQRKPMFDRDWTPATSHPQDAEQFIYSYEQYLQAMRKPRATGDEVIIAAFHHLLHLRTILLQSSQTATRGSRRATCIFDTGSFRSAALGAHEGLSSEMCVVLVRTGDHFDWSHRTTDDRSDDSNAMCERFLCETAIPIFDIFEGSDVSTPAEQAEPFLRKQRRLPEAQLARSEQSRARRSFMKQALLEFGDNTEEQVEWALQRWEAAGHPLTTGCLTGLSKLIDSVRQTGDMLADAPSNPAKGKHATAGAAKRQALPQPHHLKHQSIIPDIPEIAHHFSSLAQSLRVATGISDEAARNALLKYIPLIPTDPSGALLQAHQDVTASAATLSAAAAANGAASETEFPDTATQPYVFPEDGLTFVERQLGKGTRVMSFVELAQAHTNAGDDNDGRLTSAAPPYHLRGFWEHYKEQVHRHTRNREPFRQWQARLYKRACDALHDQACNVAAARRPAAAPTNAAPDVNGIPTAGAVPAPAVPATTQPADQHKHASAAAPVAAPLQPHHAAPAATHPVMPFQTPLHPTALFHTPQHQQVSQLTQESRTSSHSSPAVMLALSRERTAACQPTAASTVLVLNNDQKCMQWKQGDEKQSRGFFWSVYQAVKMSWEQHNRGEGSHVYRSFKSLIHPTMIPIICADTAIKRTEWETITDASLLTILEERLRPKHSTEYLVKLRTLRVSPDPARGSLTQRYRECAEVFLSTVNEALEAGTPLHDEAVKMAFRAACAGNQLLSMWLTESKWTNASEAHQRIVARLREFEAHDLFATLNTQPAQQQQQYQLHQQFQQQPQFLQPAQLQQQQLSQTQPQLQLQPPQQQPQFQSQPQLQQQQQQQPNQLTSSTAAPAARHQSPMGQRPRYTPDERRAYVEQRDQQRLQAQHQILVNAVQQSVTQSVNSVLQHSQNPTFSLAPTPPPAVAANAANQSPAAPHVHFATPAAQPAYAHPGLDHRGPSWHVAGAHLKCRYSPCNGLFCQCCGQHGHTAENCRRRLINPTCNHNGYYSEQRPNQGPVEYATAPGAGTAGSSRPPPRFGPPPTHSVPPAFPTPHHINSVLRPGSQTSPAYTPVVRSNTTRLTDAQTGSDAPVFNGNASAQ